MTNVYSNYSSFIFNVAKLMQKNGISEREAKDKVIEKSFTDGSINLDELSFNELTKQIDYERLMNTFISTTSPSQNNSKSYIFDKDTKSQTIKIGDKKIVVTADVSGNNSIQVFVDNNGKISVFNNGGEKLSFLNADKNTDLDINIVESEKEFDIIGGHGNNTIVVQENAKVGNIFGQEGNDIIINAGSATLIDGNEGNDIILNSGKAKYIDGWSGNDIIYNKGTVSNHIWGYTGDDKIINDKTGNVKKIMDESDNDRVVNYGSARVKKGTGMDVVINKKVIEFADGNKMNLKENETAYFDDDDNVVVFNEEDNISKAYSSFGKLVYIQIGDTFIPYTYEAEITKNADGTYTINHTNFIEKDDESFDKYKFTTTYSKDGNLLKAQFGENCFESKGEAILYPDGNSGYSIIDSVSSDSDKLTPDQFAYMYSPYGILQNQISIENNTITFKDNNGEITNVELNDSEKARINPDGTVFVITPDVGELYNVTYSKEGIAIATSKELKIAESIDDENGNPKTQWNTLTFENLLDNEMVLIGSDGLPLSNITKQEPYLVYDRKTNEIKTDFPLSSDGVYFYMQNPDYKLDNISALLISGQAMCVTEDFSLFLSQHYNAAEQKYYYTDETGKNTSKTFNEMKAIWEAANPNRTSVVDWETDEIFNPEIVNENSLDEAKTPTTNPSSPAPKDVISDSRNKTICEFLGWLTDKNITNAQYDENGNIKSFSADNKDYTVTTNSQGKITGLTVKSNNTILQKINCTYSSTGSLLNKYEYNYDENGVKKSYTATSFNTNGTKADEITYTYNNSAKLANYKKQLYDLQGNLLYTREKSYVDSEGKISSKIISDKITSANYSIEDTCLSTYPCIYSFNSSKCTLKFEGGKTITFKDNENVSINIDGTVTVTDKDGKITRYNRRGFPI